MHVVATAGHVDHGKSRLVQTLTGIDPDRWEEEKRRGLTIDLGFAWLTIGGQEVGIVDVPGHERFIKNMLAGVGAVNATLFIVAANEGWKPQSQEHLDILDLLDVRNAVVALTKVDLVDETQRDAAIAEVTSRLAPTSLSGAEIVPVSAVTGVGLESLQKALGQVLDRAPAPNDQGRPRLWVDRAFTIAGSGTVVTGTLIDGGLSKEEVLILPPDRRARVRSIQSHQKQVETIGPGHRTALNLAGVDSDDVRRGDVVTRHGSWAPTSRLLVTLRFVSGLPHAPTERGSFKFYLGSAERDAQIRFLEAEGLADVRLAEPVVADWHDRFVLRDAGRRETLGGGQILEPHAEPQRRPAALESARRRVEATDRQTYAQVLVEETGAISVEELWTRAGITAEAASHLLGERLDSLIVSSSLFAEVERTLVEAVQRHQSEQPLSPGLPLAAARSLIELDPRAFDKTIGELVRRGSLVADEEVLRTAEHAPAATGPARDSLIDELSRAGASPPTIPELEKRFDPALIKALVRSRELLQISNDLVYPAAWIAELKRSLKELLDRSGPFTVAAFRDAVGTTRKYAVPLLEYLDQIGFTRRRGDLREPGPKA